MRPRFAEADLPTKYGVFRIRVYDGQEGKETVVIVTKKFDRRRPALVRIHSECLTGETFGSLRCDCGAQLAKAMKLIRAHGNGAIVYLRQEGRGIGLFDKIRAYRLQDEGYDTFEANILLGHRADERTYGMAKRALRDLGARHVTLLTSNPAKVAGIEKLGIDVVGHRPLVVPTNKYSRTYVAAKRDRFNGKKK